MHLASPFSRDEVSSGGSLGRRGNWGCCQAMVWQCFLGKYGIMSVHSKNYQKLYGKTIESFQRFLELTDITSGFSLELMSHNRLMTFFLEIIFSPVCRRSSIRKWKPVLHSIPPISWAAANSSGAYCLLSPHSQMGGLCQDQAGAASSCVQSIAGRWVI